MIDVLIVGAGPVGLALAIDLGLRGVNVRIVEQRIREGAQPRAKTTNVRTMQHMRRWGIADLLREASPLPHDYPTDIVFATTLLGTPIAVIENAFEGAKRRDMRFPEAAQWVPQYTVEQVLQRRLEQLPSVQFASGLMLEGATQSDTAIIAQLRETAGGPLHETRARYLVGADGARSRVRAIIGATMKGERAMMRHYNLVLRIPELKDHARQRQAIMYWLINPTAPSVMSPLGGDIWTFGLTLPAGVETIEDNDVVGRVCAAIGRTVQVDIIQRDLWAAHRLVADRYSDRRVFLAGDACHLHPPFGGYGMNLGIGDAVDLSWKLAATLQGWGGAGLLDSYEQERRPIHLRTIAEAVENYRTLSDHLVRDGLDDETSRGARARAELSEQIVTTKSREFKTLGVVLGSRYDNSPAILNDGTSPPPDHHAIYQPSAHPGCLAPHAWLEDGSSLYDHFGLGFTLLVFNGRAHEAAQQIELEAAARGVPLKRLDFRDPALELLYAAPLAMIRPDQFVAWRGSSADAALLIQGVCGHKLQTKDVEGVTA
ncbi:FAD-dependent monooxygenase [Bradyrhizobium jicamae]|uniref:FAD-dependent monooxygenase n=1 Tax=Bradyrhizobium jicamae TaxID=280332 RepID=UPI001BA6D6A7|nr:FAD-dependent monooxygenase [Bradyrhizobium jicamae]